MSGLLLVSALPEDLQFATKVAETAGLELIHCNNAVEGAKLFQEKEPNLVFSDASTADLYTKLETALAETVGLFSERINPNTFHYISSRTIDQVPYLLESPIFGHLLLRKFDPIAESGEHYGRIVRATLNERTFGLAGFLKPQTKVQKIQLVSSDQKQSAVDAVKNYLIAAKFQTRMATLIANAVDETLMNAMYDAPVDELGKQIYANTPRNQTLKLEGKAVVELQVGFDGVYTGITVVDRFGSLDKARLLAHVSKVYTEEEYKVKASQAGAGIGLASVYRSGGSFFFASELRDRTEVTVFFKRTDSYREFKEQFRFFCTQFYF